MDNHSETTEKINIFDAEKTSNDRGNVIPVKSSMHVYLLSDSDSDSTDLVNICATEQSLANTGKFLIKILQFCKI